MKITIAYFSGYGHTAKIADSMQEYFIANGADSVLLNVAKIDEDGWNRLNNSDAIVFGTPTYMGGVAAQFKTFMDASSKYWQAGAWKDKIAAGFTNSASYSGDKLSTLQQLLVFAMQHRMIWVGQAENPPVLSDKNVPDHNMLNRLGSYTGLMTQSNHTAGPDIAPPVGDLETSKLFAKRILEITKKFV